MASVFLSHSSADAAAAKIAAQLLRNAGLTVWLELDQTPPGNAWLPTLEAALQTSTHFVVLVGENGVRRWVEREVRYALERNTADPSYRIFPLLLPGAIEQDLPLFLKQQQFLRLDWGHPDPDAIQHVAAAILGAPPGSVSILPPGESPFRGLLAFDTSDALLFFGRDREVDDLLQRLPNTHFLPVVGDSGSGKSSLVRAGLIPALLRGRMGVVDWRIAIMKPGDNPSAALAEAAPQWEPKLQAGERAGLIQRAKELVQKETDGLGTVLAALQLPANSRQILVIDQFEQLFTLARPNIENEKDAAAHFLDTVLHASQRANSSLHVVVTLRVDFFGLCYRHPELWKLVTEHQYSLNRMEPERLRETIEKPMALAGLSPAPGLVDTMLADVGTQPGGLALLEHALDRLWNVSGGRQATFDDYQKIGGLKGAIQKHADDVIAKKLTTAGQRETARRIFVALTALGEGTEDSARRFAKQDLLSLPGENAAHVLQVLADERLVTAGDARDRESIGIAHEALIREWKDLRGWIDGRRADIRFQRELEESWRKWKGDEEQLLRGGRLEDAARWVKKNPGELRPEVRAFVETSIVRAQRRKLVTRAVVATLLLLTGFSLWQWRRAESLRAESLVRQLAVESSAVFQTPASYGTAALLAVESMKRRPTLENFEALRQASALIARQVSRLLHSGPVIAVAFSPDGKFVATGSTDKTARLMEAATGKELWRVSHDGRVNAVAFSPDGKFVATGDEKRVRLMEVVTGKKVWHLDCGDRVNAVAFSPDSKWLATGSDDKTSRVMEAPTGHEVSRLTHEGRVNGVAFSPDGKFVATASHDKTARLVEAATGKELWRLTHPDSVFAVAFSPDGKWVATGSKDRTARVIQAATGRLVSRLVHQGPIRAVAFSPDSQWVATGSEDQTARVMEAATGYEVSRLAHQDAVFKVAFSPDGAWLATASLDKTARLMEAATGREMSRLAHEGQVFAVAYSPVGQFVATGSDDKTARVMQPRLHPRITHAARVYAVAVSPDGKFVATGSDDNTARVMDVTTGKVSTLSHEGPVLAVTFSPDGKWVATGSTDRTARIMESATGREVSRLNHGSWVDAVAFSPDGKFVVTGSKDKTVRVMDAATGNEVSKLVLGNAVETVACSPDGKRVATGSDDKIARVMDLVTGKEVWRTAPHGSVMGIAFSPDGKWVATGSKDARLRVMEAATGKEVSHSEHQGTVLAVVFSPDSKWVATGADDKTLRVIDAATGKEHIRHHIGVPVVPVSFIGNSTLVVAELPSVHIVEISRISIDPTELIREACSRLPRNFTREEWDQYLPGESCHATCPNLPDLCTVRK